MKNIEKSKIFVDTFNFNPSAYATHYARKSKRAYYIECSNKFDVDKGCQIGKTRSPCRGCDSLKVAPVTNRVIIEHITGKKVHAFFPLFPNGTCQFAAIDLDDHHTIFDVETLVFFARKYGLCPYVATSSSKGWHIYFFFEGPVSARLTRDLLYGLMEEVNLKIPGEVFPKQEYSQGLGNHLTLPMIEPAVRKGRNAFLNPDKGFEPYSLEAQWEYLKQIVRIPKELLAELSEEFHVPETDKYKGLDPDTFPLQIKPCIQKALVQGTDDGFRNNTGIIIASELCRVWRNPDQVLGGMRIWNSMNRDSLPEEKVLSIVFTACDRGYSYGCRTLGRNGLVECGGKESCPYFQEYRQLKLRMNSHNERKNDGKKYSLACKEETS
ncbi:hypothetical protein BVY01_04855 [bacterium I07]|nr:hypothetical protein BVY01_04855 [bacterium I07]